MVYYVFIALDELVVHAVSSDITLKYIGWLANRIKDQNVIYFKHFRALSLNIVVDNSARFDIIIFLFIYNNLWFSLHKVLFTFNEEII